MRLELASQNDQARLLKLFQASPGYFLKCDGCLPTERSVAIALTDGPKTRTPEYTKELYLISDDQQDIGVLDFHHHHPEVGITYLGLLLIREDQFGKGMGRASFDLGVEVLRTRGIKKIRLGVANENNVTPFWRKMGFVPNGREYEFKGEEITTHVIEFEKGI
jgi:GNAT superfamily N-acetyltransferase